MKVDCRGEICPYPMMRAVEAMKKARPGETIEVVTDHPPALETVPAQAAKMGWKAETRERGSGEWAILLSRADAA
jgi:TusA-related sulfurtransferase